MSLDPNKTYLVWNGTEFPNSTNARFMAPAGSTIDWGDGTVETFDTASTTVNTHTYTDGKTEHTITISGLTSIDFSAFAGCSSLTSVTIGNNVTRIYDSVFSSCGNLTSVTIGNNVTRIGSWVFHYCRKLTSLVIPDSVTSIDGGALSYCVGLTSITIGNKVNSIGYAAFEFCSSLTSLMIPDSVTSIGNNAFINCSSLTQLILFPSTPPTLGSGAIPNNVKSIYVQQSSKETYKANTNWKSFASKVVSDNIYLSFIRFNQKNKEYINGKIGELSSDFGLAQGDQKYSIVQKRIKSDGSTVTTRAYQRGSAAFGGGTVAGDSSGAVTAYSFAFAANENNEAKARSSAAFGRYNKTFNPGEFVCGSYAEEENRSPETVFLVGGGANSERRHNAFEVRTAHDGNVDSSNAYIGGRQVATQDYVNYNAVHKEGSPYVVYINEADGKSAVMPYRFNKQSIVDGEYTLMFQPMYNGRLYTRYPTDEYHSANKGYVDKFAYNYLGESTVDFTPPVVGVYDPAGVKTIIFNNFNSDLTLYDSFYLKIEATLDKNEFLANTQYANHYINCNNEDEAVVVRKFGADNRTFETIIAIEKNSHDKYLFEMSGTTDGGTKRVTSFSFGNREKNSISLSGVFYQNGGSWGTIKVKLYGRRLCISE